MSYVGTLSATEVGVEGSVLVSSWLDDSDELDGPVEASDEVEVSTTVGVSMSIAVDEASVEEGVVESTTVGVSISIAVDEASVEVGSSGVITVDDDGTDGSSATEDVRLVVGSTTTSVDEEDASAGDDDRLVVGSTATSEDDSAGEVDVDVVVLNKYPGGVPYIVVKT